MTQQSEQQKRGRGRPRGGITEPERVAKAHEANRRRGQETKALELIEAGWLVVAPEDVELLGPELLEALSQRRPWRERAEQRRDARAAKRAGQP